MKFHLKKNAIDVQLIPLSFFFDLAMAETVLQIAKVFDSTKSKVVLRTPTSSPPSPPTTSVRNETKKLHDHILRDLDLSNDYDIKVKAYHQRETPASPPSSKTQVRDLTIWCCHIDFRCYSLPQRLPRFVLVSYSRLYGFKSGHRLHWVDHRGPELS